MIFADVHEGCECFTGCLVPLSPATINFESCNDMNDTDVVGIDWFCISMCFVRFIFSENRKEDRKVHRITHKSTALVTSQYMGLFSI